MLILTPECSFDALAAAMEQMNFSLRDVRSCTFPSRPEPREASWAAPTGALAYHYCYEPDLEVRLVWLVQALDEVGLPKHFDLEASVNELLGEVSFERWSDLRDALHDPAWATARRAAAAWRARAERALSRQARELCAKTLARALEEGALLTRRAVTEQLSLFTHPLLEEPLKKARADDDLEVRLHAHRALELLESARLLRS